MIRRSWQNCRGGLHGLLALYRVVDSDTLRERALRLCAEEELVRELRRRQLRREHAEYHSRRGP